MDPKHFFHGAVSGCLGVVVSQPFDYAKTIVQLNQNNEIKQKISFSPLAWYRGSLPAILGVVFEKSIVFGTYTNMKKYTDSDFIAGGVSGLMASLVVTPAERLKILLQTKQKINFDQFRISYFFKGLSATFTRETPGFAIYFTVYEFLKNQTNSKTEISFSKAFLFGAISGSMSWIFIYPQDKIKTRMQASNIELNNESNKFVKIFLDIFKNGGIREFYRGFHFALMRAIPLHATALATMEICQKYF